MYRGSPRATNDFQKAYGNIKNSDVSHYRELYKDFSKHQLKSELKNLKKNCGSLDKISCVSKLIRSKNQSKNGNQLHRDNIDMTDHDAKFKENLWTYAFIIYRKEKDYFTSV